MKYQIELLNGEVKKEYRHFLINKNHNKIYVGYLSGNECLGNLLNRHREFLKQYEHKLGMFDVFLFRDIIPKTILKNVTNPELIETL